MSEEGDERPFLFVSSDVPSSDEVRIFYEVPDVVSGRIRKDGDPNSFVECLVALLYKSNGRGEVG